MFEDGVRPCKGPKKISSGNPRNLVAKYTGAVEMRPVRMCRSLAYPLLKDFHYRRMARGKVQLSPVTFRYIANRSAAFGDPCSALVSLRSSKRSVLTSLILVIRFLSVSRATRYNASRD